jgi:hypothetical protein
MRVVAVDWSGAKDEGTQRRHIWTAVAEDGVLTALAGGATRAQLVASLVEDGRRDGEVVVGFDFAFGAPAWFMDDQGLATAHELWALAERDGARWLEECRPPFWGRPGTSRPALPGHFRRTELEHPGAKSVFQVGGAGAVGTGSIRGMPSSGTSTTPVSASGPSTSRACPRSSRSILGP